MKLLPFPRIWNKRDPDVPADAVYVGRPTKWGNPFSHHARSLAEFRVATVQEAVAHYEEWIFRPEQQALRVAARQELRGKDLVCWGCSPCHAEILRKIANS